MLGRVASDGSETRGVVRGGAGRVGLAAVCLAGKAGVAELGRVAADESEARVVVRSTAGGASRAPVVLDIESSDSAALRCATAAAAGSVG